MIDLIDLKAEKAKHQRLWNWLAANPHQRKVEWYEWEVNGGTLPMVLNSCFACDVCYVKCDECPIEWPCGVGCKDPMSLFHQWGRCEDHVQTSKLAKQIADMPWKFEKRLEYIFGEEDHEDKPTKIPEL